MKHPYNVYLDVVPTIEFDTRIRITVTPLITANTYKGAEDIYVTYARLELGGDQHSSLLQRVGESFITHISNAEYLPSPTIFIAGTSDGVEHVIHSGVRAAVLEAEREGS